MSSSERGILGVWVTVLAIWAAISSFGWYYEYSNNNSDNLSTNKTSNYPSEESDDIVSAYKEALYEANERIEYTNGCVSESFELLDGGYFEDGMYGLDECRSDPVDEPY